MLKIYKVIPGIHMLKINTTAINHIDVNRATQQNISHNHSDSASNFQVSFWVTLNKESGNNNKVMAKI